MAAAPPENQPSSSLPAILTTEPDNQKAAADHQQFYHHRSRYLLYSPVNKPNANPLEPVVQLFTSWAMKTDTIARNIWNNYMQNSFTVLYFLGSVFLMTGPSVVVAALSNMNLKDKSNWVRSDSLYKQIFPPSDHNEKLKKKFTCYLSATTGPVAGTLYLSTGRVAFCSDRPLSFSDTAAGGEETWSYYMVVIPLGNIGTVMPMVTTENPSERWIRIVTVDGHGFWFMGFGNYEKALHNLVYSF